MINGFSVPISDRTSFGFCTLIFENIQAPVISHLQSFPERSVYCSENTQIYLVLKRHIGKLLRFPKSIDVFVMPFVTEIE